MAVVNELITKFSFVGSTAPLGNFNEKLGGAIGLLGKMLTGVVAISGAIGAMVVNTLAGADAVGQLALNANVGVEALQELGYAASVSGSSSDALYGSITRLSEKIGEAAQRGNEDFQALGISVRGMSGEVKSADVILTELAQRFQEMQLSRPEQIGFAQRLGIEPSLIQLLNKTSGELALLRNRARELGVVSADQQQKILDFNDSFTTLRYGMDAIQKQVAISLSPAIKEAAEQFTNFLIVNKEFIQGALVTFGNAIKSVLEALGRMKWVLLGALGALTLFGIATIGLGTILAAIFSPVYLITAGIILLFLAIDDLIVAMQGGQSVIRDFFLEFFGFDVVPWISDIIDVVKLLGQDLLKLLPIIRNMVGHSVDLFKNLGNIIKSVFKGVFALISGDLQGFIDNIKNAFAGLANHIKLLFAPIADLLDKAGGLLGFGADVQPALPQEPQLMLGHSRAGNNSSTQNSVSQQVKIDIKTNDPVVAGQTAADALQGQLENANIQFMRGGR
jgi:hypothetical protein